MAAPCSVEDCDRTLTPPYGRGMCSKHYQRWRRNGDPLYVRPTTWRTAECSIEGCIKLVAARGWCTAHWTRWSRYGSPTARVRGEVVDGKRICPRCGEDKPLAEWSQGECKQCTRDRASERRRVKPDPRAPRQTYSCDSCGEEFSGDRRQRRYCSRACLMADKPNNDWQHTAARRAIIRAATEKFRRADVFARDGWVCGICAEPIDPGARRLDPLSASVDHVVPLSRGGEHSLANVQAAHLTCNIRKGVSMPNEREVA